MKVESLEELKAAADDWRRKKRHAREAVPVELVERVRRTIGVHGLAGVVRATKIDRARLMAGRTGLGKLSKRVNRRRVRAAAVPSFSRVEVVAPAATSRLFAEIETPTGLKLRVFAQTHETLGLLSSLCGVGGTR